MIDPKYLIYHDLIGIKAYAKLESKKDKSGFSDIGIIIDDTKNMLIAQKENKVKKYIKKNYVFRFDLPNYSENNEENYIEVQGDDIVGFPVNRLRSLKKKRWYKK
ncbi:MAG: ribonuclease P protein subunit [Promethearchaeota archaeon]